jgi:hypothetical protein
MTNCVVPKKTFAVAVSRTPPAVVLTTGSRTVTPLTVCGKEDAAAFVSSASLTVRVKIDDGVTAADGRGVGNGVGVAVPGETLGLDDGKTTRAGPQPRTTANPTMKTTARTASRASDLTP